MFDKNDRDENNHRLVAPFSARQSSIDGFEIVDADGIVAIWVYGESRATGVVRVLNLADEEEQI